MKKQNGKAADFRQVFRTIIHLITLSPPSVKWFVFKCANGAAMGISWGIITRYIEYFTQAAIARDMEMFKSVTLVYVLLIVFMLFIRFTGPFTGYRYSIYTIRDMRRNILRNIHGLRPGYFDDHHSGDALTKLSNDLGIVENFITNDATTLFGYLPGALGYGLFALFSMNAEMTLVILPITLVTSMFTMGYSMQMRGISSERQSLVSRTNEILRDILENIGITKVYDLRGHFYRKYDEQMVMAQDRENRTYRKNQVIMGMGYLIQTLPLALVYLLGISYIGRGSFTVPQLIAYTAMMMGVFGSFSHLFMIISNAAQVTGVMDHIREITDTEKERTDGEDFSAHFEEDAFIFRNVDFEYCKDVEVVKGMSFSIPRGARVSIAGKSGCGKSTVARLLQGYYGDYGGEIEVNGKELRGWNLDALRSNFSYVSQDDYLFSDSIRSNVLYGDPGAEEERFLEVCRDTGIDVIAREMKDGYATMVGERGSMLSGGQRQRISLARALLSDKPYLVLDEPTSNLDTESEYFIEKAIRKTGRDKTILVIAHRLSTIIHSDMIMVMGDGRIIEQGSHAELMDRQAAYFHLYHGQVTE
ncbi:MAG: ABC transporter ATP-binding protein [Clostridia bacterium]